MCFISLLFCSAKMDKMSVDFGKLNEITVIFLNQISFILQSIHEKQFRLNIAALLLSFVS